MLNSMRRKNLAERVGFEPTAPFGVTGFQDQLLKPLGHLSIAEHLADTNGILIHKSTFVNCFSEIYSRKIITENTAQLQLYNI